MVEFGTNILTILLITSLHIALIKISYGFLLHCKTQVIFVIIGGKCYRVINLFKATIAGNLQIFDNDGLLAFLVFYFIYY